MATEHITRKFHEITGLPESGHNFRHGAATAGKQTKEYLAWLSAKARCFNPKTKYYRHYGGRGITMCDEWKNDFVAFLTDMGPSPKGMSLDRYPNQNGNYEPGNCRWATQKQQNYNKRTNRHLTFHGETKILCQWCEELGIKVTTVLRRLDNEHLSVEEALNPILRRGQKRKNVP